MENIFFHIDVNSAFLSWTAVELLKESYGLDIRTVPSVVAGDPKTRTGVVLAKSIPCKKYNIVTGEPLYSAMTKCPTLLVFPTNFDKYIYYSNQMKLILENYSDKIEKFSIDEYFITYIPLLGNYMEVAKNIQKDIFSKLGFTVNIGISSNRLLAKMASDFEKPNKIHTLFLNEIKDKMWPLSVSDLFLVGPSTSKKLKSLGITTIGKLANCDANLLVKHFHSHGRVIHDFANGLENSHIRQFSKTKSVGNSGTSIHDITSAEFAYYFILGVVENVTMRLRSINMKAKTIALDIKNSSLQVYSKSITIDTPTDITNVIYNISKKLFDNLWNGDPIRHIGINLSNLVDLESTQLNLFDVDLVKNIKLDSTIDNIRKNMGDNGLIMRGCFVNSEIKSTIGGSLEK